MTDTEAAYLAGLFDGEGCVALYWHKSRRTWSPRISIQLKLGSRGLTIISRYCKNYGSRLYVGFDMCRFYIYRRDQLLRFIEDVIPYTTLKTSQLLLLKNFLETDKTYAFRAMQQIKALKRRY